jgi:hypothetical protein
MDRWLPMGPTGINGVKVGDLIIRLGSRSAFYVLRPLVEGTLLLRGLVRLQ